MSHGPAHEPDPRGSVHAPCRMRHGSGEACARDQGIQWITGGYPASASAPWVGIASVRAKPSREPASYVQSGAPDCSRPRLRPWLCAGASPGSIGSRTGAAHHVAAINAPQSTVCKVASRAKRLIRLSKGNERDAGLLCIGALHSPDRRKCTMANEKQLKKLIEEQRNDAKNNTVQPGPAWRGPQCVLLLRPPRSCG